MKDKLAFPQGGYTTKDLVGMTLREWYAGQALASGFASSGVTRSEEIAARCVCIADALLIALEKPQASGAVNNIMKGTL